MKKIIYIIIFLTSLCSTSKSQNCIDFEGNYSLSNWNLFHVSSKSILNDAVHHNYLHLVDGSGGSIAVNYNEFSGNWLLKGKDGCLCFDYKVVWNGGATTLARKAPSFGIYSGPPIVNVGSNTSLGNTGNIRTGFIGDPSRPDISNGNWDKFCLPIGLAVNNDLPSNSFGKWVIYDGTTQLTGAAAATAWDNLIQNVTGFYLGTDYNADPSEEVNFDNFCWDCKIVTDSNTCSCGQWGSIGYSISNVPGKFLCSNGGASTQLEANQGDMFTLSPTYFCNGATVANACNVTFKYDVFFANGGTMLGVGDITNAKIDSCGLIRVIMRPFCNGVACPPCEFTINVKCCSCTQNLSPTLYWNNNTDSSSLQCNSTVTDKLECYKNYIVKVKSPCGPNCTDYEVFTSITYPNGLVQTSTSTTGVPITVGSLIGNYIVSIKVKCNGKWCEECKIIFKQTKPCKPACDNCKNQDGSPKVQAVFNTGSSTSVVNTFPASTTINAAFMLGGGTDTYTQVRVNILDVQMMSGKYDNAGNFVPGLAECLQCYNNPNQWVSILSGTFSLPAFVPSSTTYGSIPTTNSFNNSREITFTSNTAAAIPMGTGFNLSLQLPGVNPVSCCCITTKIFIKITYRNNKCEECSRVVVVDFTQCPGGSGDAGSSSTGGNAGTGTGVFNSAGGHPQYRISSPNNDVAPSKNNN